MGFSDWINTALGRVPRQTTIGTPRAEGQMASGNTESGSRLTFDELWRVRSRLWIDTRLLQVVQDIRSMDALDGRVKKIHSRSARTAVKGGIRLVATGQPWLEREWNTFMRGAGLHRQQKLQSDMRALIMEGNLAIQWVLDNDRRVVGAPRMPAESLRANTGISGTFENPAQAYDQVDLTTGQTIATFGLWQLTLGRLDPANYDDWGSLGRPYLDASRGVWKKLDLTEEDLVIRRHMRSPQRMSHVLEGASPEELNTYREGVERDQASGNVRDYYSNKKGSVTPIQGDANLEQIADVAHLLDSFFSGSPAPKGLFGYIGDISRDVLEDLKKDWYEELAAMQEVGASVYEEGFRLHLLLRGKNPDAYDFYVAFEERLTDTPNQRADHALKLQALGASRETVFETAGLNATAEKTARQREAKETDPYPEDVDETDDNGDPIVTRQPGDKPRIKITPGNGPKGDSATNIGNR